MAVVALLLITVLIVVLIITLHKSESINIDRILYLLKKILACHDV